MARAMNATLVLALALVCSVPAAAVAAPPSKQKAGAPFREMGRTFRDFGRKVGEAGKEAGLKVWYAGKRVSRPALEEVQTKTRRFWGHVIEGKDRTIQELRRENAELRRRLDAKGKGSRG